VELAPPLRAYTDALPSSGKFLHARRAEPLGANLVPCGSLHRQFAVFNQARLWQTIHEVLSDNIVVEEVLFFVLGEVKGCQPWKLFSKGSRGISSFV
jgi:hypothetical protein